MKSVMMRSNTTLRVKMKLMNTEQVPLYFPPLLEEQKFVKLV